MSDKIFGEEDFIPKFAKSTFSDGGGECVEVAFTGGGVAVRDSKNRSGPVLWFSPSEWRAFLIGMRAGVFDVGA